MIRDLVLTRGCCRREEWSSGLVVDIYFLSS